MDPCSVEPQAVVAMETQPVLRNLLVTQGYTELSFGFAQMLGATNMSWFAFASWSSKVVGQFLQGATVPALLRRWLDAEDWAQGGALCASHSHRTCDRELAALSGVDRGGWSIRMRSAGQAALTDVRRYLARGNTEVFAELAPLFWEFLREFAHDGRPRPRDLDRFVARLREGASRPDQVVEDSLGKHLTLQRMGGQSQLKSALRHYYQAKFEPDPKRRAELVLLANAEVGLHEQTRLQTYIAGALRAPVERVLQQTRGAWPQLPEALRARLARRRPGTWARDVAHLFRRLATCSMLSLKLPTGPLPLGRDVRPAPGALLFPPDLQALQRADLAAVFRRYGAAPEACLAARPARAPRRAACAPGSAARDWAEFSQRMRYILVLFRSRQQDETLLQPTFSLRQVAEMKAGHVPEGPLI